MIIASGIFTAIVETMITAFVWKKRNLIKDELGKKSTFFLLAAIMVFTSVINICFLKQEYMLTTYINLGVLYTIMLIIAGIDLKTKLIPNRLLLIGIIIRVILIGAEMILQPEYRTIILLNYGLGFLFGLLFLLFLSFVSKHGIGYGDVKLFAWVGLCLGLVDTYSVLFYSVLAAAIVSIYLLLIKKEDKKTQIPFGPFVFVGYCVVLCLRLV